MTETSNATYQHPAEGEPRRRFRRTFFGYRRSSVDEAVATMTLTMRELEDEAVTLREELLEARHEASETRHDLTRARAELRYWNDRASYVDSEVARARQRANDLEQAARERADTIEADAQERSLQLVDRVCTEANAMLQAARDEAREMFLRFENDVDMSQQKLEKLEQVRTEVARSMQGALEQFEEAVRELDKVGPVRRIVESLEEPVRRPVPTFGQKKAIEFAKRFEAQAEHGAAAALSTPIEVAHVVIDEDADIADELPVLTDADMQVGESTQMMAKVQVDDPITVVDPAAGDEAVEQDETTPAATTTTLRSHEADEEFVSLLSQP